MIFVAEYVTAMKPLAEALDIPQYEMKVYMAYLVSTIMVVKEKCSYFYRTAQSSTASRW